MSIVLAVNDDGIDSVGLRSLVRELSREGFRVYVVAPLDQMSGVSKTVSFYRFGRDGRILFKTLSMEGAVRCWALNATPAESVLVALRFLIGEKPDIVVSGVNSGPNVGLEDILTSGTVGAAMEAVLNGILGVAVSLAHRGSASEEDYRLAARVTTQLSRRIIEEKLDFNNEPPLININVPLNPKGIMITKPSINTYRLRFRVNNEFLEVLRDDFEERYWDRRPGSDVWAILNNYISISILNIFNIGEPDVRFKSKLEDIVERLRIREL